MSSKRTFVSASQMRDIEEEIIQRLGIPVLLLMENAGMACVEEILKMRLAPKPRVTIFCGPGNNGGDGFVIARHLFCKGFRVQIIHFPVRGKMSPETHLNFKIARKMKIPYVAHPSLSILKKKLKTPHLIVDALFGIGFSRPIDKSMVPVIEQINAAGKWVLSVDIPSGLHADEGKPMGASIKAHRTVTFGFYKKAFKVPEAKKYTGRILLKTLYYSSPNPAD